MANAIYAALVEGHAAEVSARRNAMENASKNAVGDLHLPDMILRTNRILYFAS